MRSVEVGEVGGEQDHDKESAFDEVDMTPYLWSWGRAIDVAKDRRLCITGDVVVWENNGRKREIGCTCQGGVQDKAC